MTVVFQSQAKEHSPKVKTETATEQVNPTKEDQDPQNSECIKV